MDNHPNLQKIIKCITDNKWESYFTMPEPTEKIPIVHPTPGEKPKGISYTVTSAFMNCLNYSQGISSSMYQLFEKEKQIAIDRNYTFPINTTEEVTEQIKTRYKFCVSILKGKENKKEPQCKDFIGLTGCMINSSFVTKDEKEDISSKAKKISNSKDNKSKWKESALKLFMKDKEEIVQCLIQKDCSTVFKDMFE